ncbi:hypothetical protein PRIPAC_77681, partial [Pristionchus pacificus]|uniref:Uncharacterized protein n=1 Tax=Pristionchus pacificus TaxID=54126 RepID=A0A2A6CKG8_PRIPA
MAASTLPIMIVLTRNMVEVKSEPVEEEFGDEKDTTPLPSTSRQMIASPIIRHRKVGFALMNDKGELPPSGDIWQFNFMFSLGEDMFSQESVDMLRHAGTDFDRLQPDGISTDDLENSSPPL